ncbi:hypothetical protein EV356DRAFT_518771 [Viridothelium virens]|uniref:Mid2 domain-containing protein n=1 Tax=Viridothelium virens TaxID=1048519 RepID=A0A6A6HJJ4_VIRVR|nr:hypothetical protein EV356DRAFT_518771 [Viridothelium virens]
MSNPNDYVSNGTCYTAPGQKLDGSFIPCGNDAFGYQTCCGAGDKCLADNACFGFHGTGYGSYLTYWAGCTDPNYADITCPKKVVAQPWVALTLCDNSNGEWAICSQKGNPSTLQPGAYCSCTVASSATIAFSDSASLANICSLPQSTGQSIQFLDGHIPSSVLASGSAAPSGSSDSASTSASGSSSNARSSSSPTSGPTSTKAVSTVSGRTSISAFTSSGRTVTSSVTIAPSTISSAVSTGGSNSASTSSSGNTSSGLSPGAKIGIGVGAGIGGLIFLVLVAIFFLIRRKRRRRPSHEKESGDSENGKTPSQPAPFEPEPSKSEPSEKKPIGAPSRAPTVRDENGQMVPEADVRPAAAWPLRSELEGSPVTRKEEMPPIAELPGSENFAGEQGRTNTLAQEANRQIGPAWRGSSLRVLNNNQPQDELHF